jgi:hypothetical protein
MSPKKASVKKKKKVIVPKKVVAKKRPAPKKASPKKVSSPKKSKITKKVIKPAPKKISKKAPLKKKISLPVKKKPTVKAKKIKKPLSKKSAPKKAVKKIVVPKKIAPKKTFKVSLAKKEIVTIKKGVVPASIKKTRTIKPTPLATIKKEKIVTKDKTIEKRVLEKAIPKKLLTPVSPIIRPIVKASNPVSKPVSKAPLKKDPGVLPTKVSNEIKKAVKAIVARQKKPALPKKASGTLTIKISDEVKKAVKSILSKKAAPAPVKKAPAIKPIKQAVLAPAPKLTPVVIKKAEKETPSVDETTNKKFEVSSPKVKPTFQVPVPQRKTAKAPAIVPAVKPKEEKTPKIIPYEDLGELPESYGTKKLFFISRDPHWLFAYWDWSRAEFQDALKRSPEHKIFLRLVSEFNGVVTQVQIHDHFKNYYLQGYPDHPFFAQIGYYSNGHFIVESQSGTTVTPRDGSSGNQEVRFVTIPMEYTFAELWNMVKHLAAHGEDLAQVLARLQYHETPLPFPYPIKGKGPHKIIFTTETREIFEVWLNSMLIITEIKKQLPESYEQHFQWNEEYSSSSILSSGLMSSWQQ